MKIMKRIAMLMLSVCLVLPCFSILTYAADGKIMFTDHPAAVVGETLNVRGVVEADSALEDMTVRMTYDTSMLKFVSGENVTETSAGQLRFELKGQVHGSRVQYNMTFDVLKEGTTEIRLLGYDVWLDSDEKVVCQEGYSTIVIAEGEGTTTEEPEEPEQPEEPTEPEVPATGINVDVNGVMYTFTDEFAAEAIPEGFAETSIEYEGAQRRVVQDATAGITLGYLVNAENVGKFFMYMPENATFAAFEQVVISESTTITLLSDTAGVTLPQQYAATEVTVNEQQFPAWQDVNDTNECILYAVNNRGEKSLYRLDIEEGTYQRFEAPEVVEENDDDSMFGKLSSVLKNHLDYVILVTGLGFILFVIVIIVLSVKLYNRNAELDELYDEYGIDLDSPAEKKEINPEEVKDSEVKESEEAEEAVEAAEETADETTEETEEDSVEESLPVFEDLEELFADLEESMEEETQQVESVKTAEVVVEEPEIEVEFFAQDITAEVVEDSLFEEEVLPTSVQNKEKNEFYDDDDFFDDFDVDFIDLED